MKLLRFAPYKSLHKSTKKQRFFDKLNEKITLYILYTTYPTYQSTKDVTL